MKKYTYSTILLILTLAFTINAQDLSRIEKLTDHLKTQAADLVIRTNRDLRKDGLSSGADIENAFLAEQLQASTSLLGRIVSYKRHSSEMRYAGMVIADLSRRFPTRGANGFEWKTVKDTVNELSRELRGLNSGVRIERAGYKVNGGSILGKATWNGTVDADVLLKIKGGKISLKTVAGKTYREGAYSFSSNLPRQNRIRMGVRVINGRGKAHVMQQPDENNDYTALVQIHDEDAGADDYSLEIYWYRR